MMSNIKVAVRLRPLNKREIELGSQNVVEINGDTISVTNLKVDSQPEYGDSRERVKVFTFDYCYDSSNDPCIPGYASQQLVFQDLGTEILEAAFEGYNACVFAYGQTSTGKTYTMMGDPGEAGLIPRICEGLFSRVDDFIDENFTFKVDISYLEIYNERVRDLLQSPLLKPSEKYTLKVREHPKEGPYVQDLSRHLIKDNNEIQALIEKANENRTTSSTHMHEHSSRSHAIVTVTFTQARLEDDLPSEIVSKVHLVDLAGSERASTSTTANYKDRLKEGANINKSLVTLGNVIKCLAERSLMSLSADDADAWSQGNSDVLMTSSMVSTRKHRTFYVPYRDSVLTWLLKDSLGGNSKTIMISTISPANIYYNETVSTLRYAQRAKSIINKPKINEDSNVTLIKELRREIERLRDMLATAQTKSDPEPCPDAIDMKGNLLSLQESSTFLSEKLEENEAAAKKLTMHWIEKWQETHDILTTEQLSVKMTCKDGETEKPLDKLSKMLNPSVKLLLESDLSIRRPLGQRTNSMGVIVDSQQPHLRGMDDDILSTGIVLYYLKEGKTLIGGEGAERDQDIVLSGPSIQPEHCFIEHVSGDVVLHPNRGAACTINGIEIKQPSKLTQGDTILIGKTHLFRFNNPAEAARLREFRKSTAKNETENGSPLGSMDSVVASESGSSSQNCASPAPLMYNSLTGDLDQTTKNNKSNIKQIKQELQLVNDKLQKVSQLYEKQEEQLWEMQEGMKREEEELRKRISEMLADANEKQLQAEKEISKAKAQMDAETALFRKAMEKELAKKKQSPGQSSISDLEKIKKQLEGELIRKTSLQESKKVLEQKVHDMQKLCQNSKLEVEEHERKVSLLKREHEKTHQQKKEEISAMLVEIKKLGQQKDDLEMFLDEKKDLRKVAQDKPVPLRGACSEETVCYEAQRLPSFTNVKDLKSDCFRRGSDGDLPSLSNRITMSTALIMSESLVEEPHEHSLCLSESHHKSSHCLGSKKDMESNEGCKSGLSIGKAENYPLKVINRNSSNACPESVEKEYSLVPSNVGEDVCNNGPLPEDQMSNYSQDSLDRMEDEEPETEVRSPDPKHLEKGRIQKSASPCRQSGIPLAKNSPSPVRKLKEQSSSSKSNSACSGTKKDDSEFFSHNNSKREPSSKSTSSKTKNASTGQIQTNSSKSLNSSKIGAINSDSHHRPPDTPDRMKIDHVLGTQSQKEDRSKCKELSKDTVPSHDQTKSKNCVPSSQGLGNHNLVKSQEMASNTISNDLKMNNDEMQNKGKVSAGPKQAKLVISGTINAQYSSKDLASPLLVDNQTKPSSQISKSVNCSQLAKMSTSNQPTANANKEHVPFDKQSQSEPKPDGDQSPEKNFEQFLLNSKSPRTGTSETNISQSNIPNSNTKTCFSSSDDRNQKVLKDTTNANMDQKHKTQDQVKCMVQMDNPELNIVPTMNSVDSDSLQISQLKNPGSSPSCQSKGIAPRHLGREQNVLKNDNGSVRQPAQRQALNQNKVPHQKPLHNGAAQTPILSMLNGKSSNQSSSRKLLKPDQNVPLNQLRGTGILSDNTKSEIIQNNKYSTKSLHSSQEPLNQNNEDSFLKDSLENGKRNFISKDSHCTGKKSGSGCSFRLHDSIENKKEFSVITHDSCYSTKADQSAPKLSKSCTSENLTDASESSDSEIKKLTGSYSFKSSPIMTMRSHGLEKKPIEMSGDIPVSQGANLVSETGLGKTAQVAQRASIISGNAPENISRAGQNSYARPDILRLTNGLINGASSSEVHSQDFGDHSHNGNSQEIPSGNLRLSEENKVKSPFTYIVKVNQEETNVFYNVEATDYTVSTVRKHYAKNKPGISPGKDSVENNFQNKPKDHSSSSAHQVQSDSGTHGEMGGSCISDIQTVAKAGNNSSNRVTNSQASLPHTKSSLSSQSSSSISSSLLSSSLSSSSPPGQCQQPDDIPNPRLRETLAANIPELTGSTQKQDSVYNQNTGTQFQSPLNTANNGHPIETSKSENSTRNLLSIDQKQRETPGNCKNLLKHTNNQRPQTLPLSFSRQELTMQQVSHLSADTQNTNQCEEKTTNSTWPRVPKSSCGDYSHSTNQDGQITNNKSLNKRLNLPSQLVSHNLKFYNSRQQQKRLKVLTRCVSDSAISSDLTDIDSSNLSPQPGQIPSWFSMQHVSYSYFNKNSDGNDHVCCYHKPTGSPKKVLPSNNQPLLKTSNQHESLHEYVESLFRLKPFSYSRSLSMDALNQWIIPQDKPISSVKNLEPGNRDYPMCLNDQCLSSQKEVSGSDESCNNFPDKHTHHSVPDKLCRKRNTAGLKGNISEGDYQFQENSQCDTPSSLDSSSSPSSASPYMIRCKNDGSLLNLSQEEFNNLEQNLPSDISSLVSSFDGCYLGHGQGSPGKEIFAVREDNDNSLGSSSDDAVVLDVDQRQRRARIPLRLGRSKLSSVEHLEVDNIEDRVLRNIRPSKFAGQRDRTSTADSDETLYDYYKMPTYPPEDNRRACPPEFDMDTSDYQRPPQQFQHQKTKNNLLLYDSSKSASVTDLPGDYPTSTCSCRSGSPSLSSEFPGDLIPDEESLKYISIGIQASQTECATQTEDGGSMLPEFTMPQHNNILKDSVTSNMIPFPFNIPYLMAEASAGTFHTLPALMVETTNLLKNLSKQLIVEPGTSGLSPSSVKEKCNHRCSVTTQTDLTQRQPEILSPLPLPQSSSMCSSSYSSAPSSTHYSTSYQLDHGTPFYPSSHRPHPEINIHQNNFHPGMTINHDMLHTQNYINPRLTPNPASSNTYPFPYHPQQPQPEMHSTLPNHCDMHFPGGTETATLKSNCSMGDFWKGDMCDSFTYIPHHQTFPKDEMPSPGQRPYPGFGSVTRMSPQDQAPHLHANQILTPPDAHTGQYQNCQPQVSFDDSSNRYNRQFKFNQTSPLPSWNHDKYYHSMKYASPNSGQKPWNDLINYSEYNLDSSARDVHFQSDWRIPMGDNHPANQRASLQKLQEQKMSASAPDRFQIGTFDPQTPKRFRSMTMDGGTRKHLRPDNLYSPSFHRSRTLPHSGLASLGPNGDNLIPFKEFSPTTQFSSTPRAQQPCRSQTEGNGANTASFLGGDNQSDHCLSEDLNMSLKKSGLTDEYLQLLKKSARSLPKTERSTMPTSEGYIRNLKTHKILEEASQLLNANSSHSQIPSETNETKSYPESVSGAGFHGIDHLEGTMNSASSVDHSQNNELRSVFRINEEYANMIASDGKPTMDASKNSPTCHKSKSKKRQALHNQFKQWEKEQLNVIDMVNLKYLPVSFTVKYLEKKVNHCIAQTDLLLDSLDDEDPTTTSAISENNSTTIDDVFERSSTSNSRFSNLSKDYLQLPQQQDNSHQKTRPLSSSSLLEAGFDTGSELSPNAWLQLHSSIPNLLTDDAATDRDVSWTDEMGYLHHEADHPIDTLTYTKSSVASSVTDMLEDNSDQTISESQDLSSRGSLGKDAMSMLEEVSRFRKFYSAEIEKIRDGLTELDVKVSAHQSPSRNSRRKHQNKIQISTCDNKSKNMCRLSRNEASSQMFSSKSCVSDTSASKKPRSSSQILRQRSCSTDH